jgi:hypothetical protein
VTKTMKTLRSPQKTYKVSAATLLFMSTKATSIC